MGIKKNRRVTDRRGRKIEQWSEEKIRNGRDQKESIRRKRIKQEEFRGKKEGRENRQYSDKVIEVKSARSKKTKLFKSQHFVITTNTLTCGIENSSWKVMTSLHTSKKLYLF